MEVICCSEGGGGGMDAGGRHVGKSVKGTKMKLFATLEGTEDTQGYGVPIALIVIACKAMNSKLRGISTVHSANDRPLSGTL